MQLTVDGHRLIRTRAGKVIVESPGDTSADLDEERAMAVLAGDDFPPWWVTMAALLDEPLPLAALEMVARLAPPDGALWEVRELVREPAPPWTHTVSNALAQHPWSEVRRIAASCRLSAAALHRLATDPDPMIRLALTRRQDLSDVVRDQLLADPVTKHVMIGNRRWCNVDWLPRLAEDPDPLTRLHVARRTDLPRSLMERLIHDGEPRVRREMAAHPELPLPLLRALVDDPDPTVRTYVRGYLPLAQLRDERRNVRTALNVLAG